MPNLLLFYNWRKKPLEIVVLAWSDPGEIRKADCFRLRMKKIS